MSYNIKLFFISGEILGGVMKKVIFIFIFLYVFSNNALAEKVFSYRTYEEKTGKIINTFYITIGDLKENKRKVYWKKKEGKYITIEEYVLDNHYATLSWKVKRPSDRTFYVGERKGNILFLKGKLKGKAFTKKIKIDDKPFYYNPKLGLRQFVKSHKKSLKFWALRNDDVTEYLMVAYNKGLEMVNVNGYRVEAVKVYWTLPDFRSAFFKRTYWFRKSDNLYIRQKASKGQIRELVKESI